MHWRTGAKACRCALSALPGLSIHAIEPCKSAEHPQENRTDCPRSRTSTGHLTQSADSIPQMGGQEAMRRQEPLDLRLLFTWLQRPQPRVTRTWLAQLRRSRENAQWRCAHLQDALKEVALATREATPVGQYEERQALAIELLHCVRRLERTVREPYLTRLHMRLTSWSTAPVR